MTDRPPTLTLHTGVPMPQLGLGTWPMGDREAERAVATAIEQGYRLFDTAASYGNERGVGRGLRAAGVPREELFVTTKLRGRDHGYDRALAAFHTSAERLGLDYVDLYLIHWPLPSRDLYADSWRAFITLLERGLVRAIGVSNFKPRHIDRVVRETGVVPMVNQIELHPGVAQVRQRAYDASRGIVTESYSPIGKGGALLRDPILTSLAERHGKTSAQVVLRWHVQLGLVAIPKSSDPQRIAANIDVFDFELSEEDMEEIGRLDRGERAGADPNVYEEE